MSKQPHNVGKAIQAVALPSLALLLWAAAGCKPHAGPPPAPTPEVAVFTVQPQRVVIATELPGRTAPFLVAEIRPQVNGLIQKRLFTEGAEVQAGDILYQIDPAPFQAALDSAQASLARAEAGLLAIQVRVTRYNDLLKDNAISRQDYDDASAAMQQAEAEILHGRAMVKTAEINLGYTSVNAPIAGRIGKSSVTDGALVMAYQPMALATIQQLDPIYADTPQSTSALLKLRRRLADGRLNHDAAIHNKVKLVLEDGTPYPLEGTLQFQDISVDPTTGSVNLRAIFPNPDGILLPGMFVRTLVTAGVNERAMLLPQQGVARNFKGAPVALTVDVNNQVQQRHLVLDRAMDDRWLVTSGLEFGDRVIVEGMLRVRPGSTVKTVEFGAGSDSGSASGQKPDQASTSVH